MLASLGLYNNLIGSNYHYCVMSLKPKQIYRDTAIRTLIAKDGTQRSDKGATYGWQ